MKCINVLVVDDEEVKHFFKKYTEVNVTDLSPVDFAGDMKAIRESDYDAIIMDQKLTGTKRTIPYQGTTIIQEMRTRMVKSNSGMSPKPIVLWSVAKNITSYHDDKSSHNLTDAVWRKDDFGSKVEYANECIEELKDLVNGYQILNEIKSNSATKNYLDSIFSLHESDIGILPNQFTVFFENKSNRKPHIISQFIINSVLRFNGPLINKSTLLARLGVSNKSKNIDQLLNKVDYCKYRGIYSQTNNRWWTQLIYNWWISNIDNRHPSSFSAAERVSLLQKALKVNLDHAAISEGHSSNYFWNSCPFTDVPLDPIDSFKIIFPDKREWQDDIYISYNAAKNRNYKDSGYALDPLDKIRLISKLRK